MDASDFDCSAVFFKDSINAFIAAALQVLTSSKQSVVLGDSCDFLSWNFVDALSCECLIDRFAEGNIVEESLGVLGLVFTSKLIVFSFCEVEIQLGQNGTKLILGHVTFSKFVKVDKELLDSDTLHHDERA